MKEKYIASNENIILTDTDKEIVISEIEQQFKNIFDIMKIDWENDRNMKKTPYRIAKMYINEVFNGTYTKEPDITVFPNERNYDEIVVSGPISVKSMCSHHFMPFYGKAYIGYLPNKNVIGVSKLSRITEWFARRPQIQEELSEQIAEYLMKKLEPEGVIVFIKAKHMCMTHRGVNDDSEMITSVVKGSFKENPHLKNEFFEMIK